MNAALRLLLLWLVLLAAAPPPDDCRACEGAGAVACKRCARSPCPADAWLVFCSVAGACEDCRGVGTLPCRRCDADDADARAAREEAVAAWLVELRAVDAFMEKELVHLESEHFRLTWDIPRLALKGSSRPHDAAHVYLERLEALFERFVRDLGADPDEHFFGDTHVMLWDRAPEQERASLKYTRQPSRTQSKLMGAQPVVSIHYDEGHLHEEFELHQAMVHQVTHCLLSNVFDGVWPGNVGGGWIDGGLAHAYEVSLFGGVRHYCYVEGDTMQSFRFGRWESSVLAAVQKGDAPSFLGIASKHTTELSPEEHMFAWSYVDHVLRAHPGALGPLARAIKRKRPLKTALEEALGRSPFEFEAGWRAWVLETYSPKPRRGRR